MSNNFFPALPGLSWDNVRTPVWQTRRQQSVSGRVTTAADWSSPLYKWQLSYDFLRSNPTYGELQTLIGFFNGLSGSFDTFLYVDPTDNTVANQGIGEGDGSTTTFRLLRSFGGYSEPVWAGNQVVSVNGAVVASTISSDLSSVTLASAPAPGTSVTVSMTFAWRCRFSDDSIDFSNFMTQLYEVKQLNFESVK